MTGKGTAVFGIYATPEGLERAGDSLVTSGFLDSDISVLLSHEIADSQTPPSFLLSVRCSSSLEIERAKSILERTMADDERTVRAVATGSPLPERPSRRRVAIVARCAT